MCKNCKYLDFYFPDQRYQEVIYNGLKEMSGEYFDNLLMTSMDFWYG